jgi:transcriptional regulator with XRE-family HTH domain
MNIKSKSSLESKYGKMTLARFIKSYRLTESLTQSEFGKILGWSKGNICDIENGRRTIGTERAKRLSFVTGIALDYILEIILNQELQEAGIKKFVKVEFEEDKAA